MQKSSYLKLDFYFNKKKLNLTFKKIQNLKQANKVK